MLGGEGILACVLQAPTTRLRLLLFSRCGVKTMLAFRLARTGLSPDLGQANHQVIAHSKPRRVVKWVAAAQSGNDAVGELGQCHWTGYTGWRASTSLVFRDVRRFRGTGYLGSGRVGALPSSTRSTRRDRPVRGKGRSSHIGCFIHSFASPITRHQKQQQNTEKACEKTSFSSAESRCTAIPNTCPLAQGLFFPVNRHSQRSGALPQTLPRILVDLVQGRGAKPNRVPQ